MSKDAQENPWPGFVDVLSSTLLVFVFLVIIQLLVIAGVSMKVSQTVTEKMLQELLREAEEKALTITETEIAQIKEKSSQVEQTVVKEKENPVSLVATKDKLAIVYKGLSTLLENDDSEQVDQWIKDRIDLLRTSDILLNAYLGSATLSTSTSYYVSYNRMMDIRKRLVLQGVPGDQIKVRIHDSDRENHNKVELWVLESTP
ncbi:hypothetical protein [Endozoicomonas lisbonensis]|uniref:Motility protein B-like N-terminal domain-containing protein n=1 Tax=Endozoicomonas lisbonensis TaxID=3120522 RepID=A0ABV2SNX1_9GAMM